jgi:pimeloyl-ACP methyl ester carboxylesterase
MDRSYVIRGRQGHGVAEYPRGGGDTKTVLRRTYRKILLITLAIMILLPALGALYQSSSVWREAKRFPPPGKLVDVGGRRLHIVCSGEGEPAVIFEASGLGNSSSFDAVRAEVSRHTRACAYDRMGMGWSDPGPDDVSAGLFADDLQRLLDRTPVRGPYILVAASIGGATAEMFARRYPESTRGIVFVDAANSQLIEPLAPKVRAVSTRVALFCLAPTAARFGVVRLLDPLRLRRRLPSERAARAIALTYRPEPIATVCALIRGLPRHADEWKSVPPLDPDLPSIVLTHDRPEGLLPPGFESEEKAVETQWRDLQRKLSQRSTHGVWRIVPDSGHLIASTQPHAVASAILEMLAQVRREAASRTIGNDADRRIDARDSK